MRRLWTLARRAPSKHRVAFAPEYEPPLMERIHPAVRRYTREIAERSPCLPVPSGNIQVISQPKNFLTQLLSMIQRARRRIFISSLYIGSSEEYLVKALDHALRSNPELKVYLHLDYNRCTRPEPLCTAALLAPLVQAHPDRVHAHFFKSPKLKGIKAKLIPRRFDEGWGTWHAKIYGVDDEVLLSGANLNESYFTNRQDRYLHFKSPSLSEYCYAYLQTMVPYCFRLHVDGDTYSLTWPDSKTHYTQIEGKAETSLRGFQDHCRSVYSFVAEGDGLNKDTTLIFPVMQAGQFRINDEHDAVRSLFYNMSQYIKRTGVYPLVDLTSGYFGLDFVLRWTITSYIFDCRILCASPKANGFFGSRGISGLIPEAYTYLEQRFWRRVCRWDRAWAHGHGVQLWEWARSGWTYHAKGLWVSPEKGKEPVLTLFGSTNLNTRSKDLDMELSFVMVVPSTEGGSASVLRRNLQMELDGLREYAKPWIGMRRRVRMGTKLLVGLVYGML